MTQLFEEAIKFFEGITQRGLQNFTRADGEQVAEYFLLFIEKEDRKEYYKLWAWWQKHPEFIKVIHSQVERYLVE